MPIGRRFWRWFEPALRSAAPGTKAALLGLLVVAGFLYVLLGPLVFDAAYWVLGRIARTRSDPRLRVGVSVALVIVYIVALSVSGSSASPPPGATSTPLVAANVSSTAPSATTEASASSSSSATTSATPAPLGADGDDSTTISAGPSFVPSATGLPAPSSGLPADRLPGEPEAGLTPGALNPDVTQATIDATICVSDWTGTIRPPESFTESLKVSQIASYGYTDTSTSSYEEDHLISLELGGAPADPRNLWPEPYQASLPDGRPTGASTKDGFETKLKTEVCDGTITLVAAQTDIGDHWVHAYYDIPLAPSTPTPEPSVTPMASQEPSASPVASLSVRITSLPGSVKHGASATLVAVTSPGAACSASVTYHSGTVSTAAGLKTKPVANSSGIVSWTWKVGSSTKPGTSTATVTCSLGGHSASKSKTFLVT